jgi:hypothetical protein
MARNKGILGVKYGSVKPYNEAKGLDFVIYGC